MRVLAGEDGKIRCKSMALLVNSALEITQYKSTFLSTKEQDVQVQVFDRD